MKLLVIIFLIFFAMLFKTAWAQEQQVVVPYTLADRDRAILIEAKLNALESKFDSKFEGIDNKFEGLENKFEGRFENIDKQFMYQQKQIDDIKTLFYWGFGILITLFIFMLGYMIWDRRTAMQPALIQASRAEENSRNLIKTLKEYSKKHADLAEILRSHGIL